MLIIGCFCIINAFAFQSDAKMVSTNSDLQIADSLLQSGIKERKLGNYHLALRNLLSALDTYEANDNASGQALTHLSLGILNGEIEDYEMAIDHYYKALEIYKKINDDVSVAQVMNNIGLIEYKKGNYAEALKNFRQSVKIKTLFNMPDHELNYTNFGRVYFEMNQNDTALYLFRKGLIATANDGNTTPKRDSMEILHDIGKVFFSKGIYDSAEMYLRMSHELSAELGRKNYIAINTGYLAKILGEKNDYEQALMYSQLNVMYMDSLNKEGNLKTIAKIETQFLLEQMQEKNRSALERRNLIIYAVTSALLVLLVAFVIIKRNYKLKTHIELLLQKQKDQKAAQQINQLLSENELKAIKANIEGREKERKRISEELHDGIGGTLSSIKLGLINYQEEQQLNDGRLNTLAINIDKICREIRTISHDLSPPVLKNMAFAEVLEEYLLKFQQEHHITINYELDPVAELVSIPEHVKVELYRIIQESLTNIFKHADAKSIEIQLLRHDEYINLIIEDDGKGFKFEKIQNGLGLKNIQSRVSLLDGKLDIDSQPGRGTVINVDIQLP